MKKLLLLSVILFGGYSVVAQDTCTILQEFIRLTLENDRQEKVIDSLEKVIVSERDKSNVYVDAIEQLKKNFADSLSESREKYEELERVVSQLRKDLDKEKSKAEKSNDIKKERDQLKLKNAELLKSIEDGKMKLENEQKEQYEAGRKSVLNQIQQEYSYDFDVLVLSTSLQAVKRALPFVEDVAIKKKMQDLQSFFEAKQVLEEKYNEQKVSLAQAKINSLIQTNAVKTLGKSLEDYKISYDALKEAVGRIKEIDRKFIANNESSEEMKKKDILAELADYIYNYRFDFEEYPYLSNIVIEIMKRKLVDVNSPVSDLYDKL